MCPYPTNHSPPALALTGGHMLSSFVWSSSPNCITQLRISRMWVKLHLTLQKQKQTHNIYRNTHLKQGHTSRNSHEQWVQECNQINGYSAAQKGQSQILGLSSSDSSEVVAKNTDFPPSYRVTSQAETKNSCKYSNMQNKRTSGNWVAQKDLSLIVGLSLHDSSEAEEHRYSS